MNFGYFALRRSIPNMEPAKREYLEDFTFKACDHMYARDDRTGFQSVKRVWAEMGWDGEADLAGYGPQFPDDEVLQQLSVPGELDAAAQAARARLGADRAALPGARSARLISL